MVANLSPRDWVSKVHESHGREQQTAVISVEKETDMLGESTGLRVNRESQPKAGTQAFRGVCGPMIHGAVENDTFKNRARTELYSTLINREIVIGFLLT